MFEFDGRGADMTFLQRAGTPTRETRALVGWRDAEQLVRRRWSEFLAADGSSRRGAFAAYVAALRAEAAAAGKLADAHSRAAEAA
jgi:hypothetical protein